MTGDRGMRCRACAMDYWPDLSHCMQCHRTWTSLAESHCAACHEHFGSDSAFLAHQVRDECRPPPTRGLKAVERKDGVVWVSDREWSQDALRAWRGRAGSPQQQEGDQKGGGGVVRAARTRVRVQRTGSASWTSTPRGEP